MTVIECQTPAEAGKALERAHRARTFSHVQYMKQDFVNKMFIAKDGMKKHLTDMKELALRLRLSGRDVDDAELASAILISVKDKRYKNNVTTDFRRNQRISAATRTRTIMRRKTKRSLILYFSSAKGNEKMLQL